MLPYHPPPDPHQTSLSRINRLLCLKMGYGSRAIELLTKYYEGGLFSGKGGGEDGEESSEEDEESSSGEEESSDEGEGGGEGMLSTFGFCLLRSMGDALRDVVRGPSG